MPGLPDNNPDWPPASVAQANATYREHGAWWSGKPSELSQVYANSLGTDSTERPERATGLLGGRLRRFWGTPPSAGALRPARLHIPLAGDIAATSSDLLFGEPPTLGAGENEEATQDRFDDYLAEGGAASVLLEAGEVCAAFGGVYLRVGWDADVADMPLFDAIPPDSAIPEFRSGRLRAVTFWRELGNDGGKTLRHLERHEAGRIFHGLYAGAVDKLGHPRPLEDHPDTELFAALVGAGGYVETGAKGLAVEYVPNMRPHRTIRGSNLGRSDYDGVEPLFDALDEAWSSWIRDLRLGKGRVMVPSVYLQSRGRGNGATFDPEQEVFEQVDALPGSGEGLAMTVVQFQIRVAEHKATADELTNLALRSAGYSAQTFGDAGDGAQATATEITARKGRSNTTRTRKIGYFRPALRRLFGTALEIDLAQFRPDRVTAMQPTVEFPDGVADDPEAQARTWGMLRAAELMSVRTGVQLLHPEWDDEAVDGEVIRIREDTGSAPVDVPGEGTDDVAAGLDPTVDAGPSGGPMVAPANGAAVKVPTPFGR